MLLWMEGEGWMGDEILDVSRDWIWGMGKSNLRNRRRVLKMYKRGFEIVQLRKIRGI